MTKQSEVWHRILVGDGVEFAAIGDQLAGAVPRNHQDILAGIRTRREAGIDEALQTRKTRVEVRTLGDALYLNDGALRLYCDLEGDKPVDGTLDSLPHNTCLGSVISDVLHELLP